MIFLDNLGELRSEEIATLVPINLDLTIWPTNVSDPMQTTSSHKIVNYLVNCKIRRTLVIVSSFYVFPAGPLLDRPVPRAL